MSELFLPSQGTVKQPVAFGRLRSPWLDIGEEPGDQNDLVCERVSLEPQKGSFPQTSNTIQAIR